jgi:hypothetical protein
MVSTERLPGDIGTIDDPVNIRIMDVNQFIHEKRARQVTSSMVFEPSTSIYHAEGLYSEEIFGQVGSPDRMLKFGWIDLGTRILHPKIFAILCKLKRLYKDIMSGAEYAIFDRVKNDFIRFTGDPLENDQADTGYSFFMSHFHEIEFPRTGSSKRDENIEVILKYQKITEFDRHIVIPAGLRDIANDSSGRLIQDEINKLYNSLQMYTRAIPRGSNSPLYDPVRWQLQSKAQEIYEYIENFLDGKRGFIQSNFARRHVAGGTRNVITAAPFLANSPEDVQLLGADDVMVGIYQTVKGLTPIAAFNLRQIFSTPIFKAETTTNVALSDPKTFELVYTRVDSPVRDKWMTTSGNEDIFNDFRNVELRRSPVMIEDITGDKYALLFVYDEGDEIALFRSIVDLENGWPRPIDKKKIRPITYAEMLYIVAEVSSNGAHCLVTRYPVIEQGSTYPGRVHVVSTTPSRAVQLVDLVSGGSFSTTLKQYPILKNAFMDAAMVHPSKMAAMGADHDGDLTLVHRTR